MMAFSQKSWALKSRLPIRRTAGSARGYGQVIDKTLDHQFREVWNSAAGWAGLQIGHIFTGPAYFIVREAMPMLQSLLLIVVVIASPIILTVSNYSMMTLMSLSLSYTGLLFLTFWWELCRSLDSKLLEAVYSMHDNFNPITGTINSMDDSILAFVMITFYVVVPAIWFGVLGYASYRVNGVSMDSAMTKISQVTQEGTKTLRGYTGKVLNK